MNQAAKDTAAKYARRLAREYRREIEGDHAAIERKATEAFQEALNYSDGALLEHISGAQAYFETVFCNQFTEGEYDPDGTYRKQILDSLP